MNFDRLDTYLKQYIASAADIPGVDVIIQQDHKTLFRAQYGYSDLGNKTPISGDEQYYLYSCSKPLTVTGAMRLVEEGKLDLDTPVSKYLPFFGDVYLENDGLKRAPQTPITVRHLFTMTAGFTYNMDTTAIQELLKNGNRRIETVQYAKAIEQALARTLKAEVHLKNETVQRRRSLQLRHAGLYKQRTQYAIVTLDKIREQNHATSLLNDECAQVRHDQTLVAL